MVILQNILLVSGILLTFSFSVELAVTKDIRSRFLASPRVTDVGKWGDFESCQDGTFVIGMMLKTEPDQGPKGDDTALNGIRFMCGIVGESLEVLHSPERRIQSLVGPVGTWGDSYVCPKSYAVGFQLRSEPHQRNLDDTGANSLRIFCSNPMKYLEGKRLTRWGLWTHPQICLEGWAMCGIRTQVEPPLGRQGDDTALNNLEVQCCKVSPVCNELA